MSDVIRTTLEIGIVMLAAVKQDSFAPGDGELGLCALMDHALGREGAIVVWTADLSRLTGLHRLIHAPQTRDDMPALVEAVITQLDAVTRNILRDAGPVTL